MSRCSAGIDFVGAEVWTAVESNWDELGIKGTGKGHFGLSEAVNRLSTSRQVQPVHCGGQPILPGLVFRALVILF